MNIDIPLGRGRRLHLHGFGIDDRENDKEYEARVRKAESKGRKPRRRERAWNFRWHLSATLEPGERWLGTILKGWAHFGWTRYRFKWLEVEFALGGEDGMAQWSIRTPLLSWAFGVRVPARWLEGWVYQRRVWSIKLGYVGSPLRILFAYDDSMRDMQSYYRRKFEAGTDDRTVIRGRVWPTNFMIDHPGFELDVFGSRVRGRLKNRLLGKRAFEIAEGKVEEVEVVMPDGQPDAGQVYPATVQHGVYVWSRPRWRTRVRRFTEIKLEHPPMFAGKGENSWDCDDDCFYSSSGPRQTTEEAVRDYVASVVDQREKYGKPSPQPTSA